MINFAEMQISRCSKNARVAIVISRRCKGTHIFFSSSPIVLGIGDPPRLGEREGSAAARPRRRGAFFYAQESGRDQGDHPQGPLSRPSSRRRPRKDPRRQRKRRMFVPRRGRHSTTAPIRSPASPKLPPQFILPFRKAAGNIVALFEKMRARKLQKGFRIGSSRFAGPRGEKRVRAGEPQGKKTDSGPREKFTMLLFFFSYLVRGAF